MKYITLAVALLIASTDALQLHANSLKDKEEGTPQNQKDYWNREADIT